MWLCKYFYSGSILSSRVLFLQGYLPNRSPADVVSLSVNSALQFSLLDTPNSTSPWQVSRTSNWVPNFEKLGTAPLEIWSSKKDGFIETKLSGPLLELPDALHYSNSITDAFSVASVVNTSSPPLRFIRRVRNPMRGCLSYWGHFHEFQTVPYWLWQNEMLQNFVWHLQGKPHQEHPTFWSITDLDCLFSNRLYFLVIQGKFVFVRPLQIFELNSEV